jgi:hypothetical protein
LIVEDRLVNSAIGLLFFGVLLVHFIRAANAWIAAVERIQAPVVIVADEEPLELGPEFN